METIFKNTLTPIVAAVVAAALLYVMRGFALLILRRWSKKTSNELDDIIVAAIKTPSLLWPVIVGLYVGIALSDLSEKQIHYLHMAISILLVMSVTATLANLSGEVLKNYIKNSRIPIQSTGLAYVILKVTIYAVGVMITLSIMGISIAPLITALGVGGLAAALAMQDTLSNLFAGINILMEKFINVGDFVKLESGQEGYVDDITWRTTRIKMLSNNIVIVPNNKMSQSVITNYHLPDKRMSLLIPISVSYSSDIGKVERILVEEAKKASGSVPGLLAEPEPFVRFIPGFGASSVDFTLICHLREFVDQYLAQHELRKMIFKRFAEEGIQIPYPHQTVYLRVEKKWKK